MTEFIAPSGAKVVINVAPWVDAKILQKALLRELAIAGEISLSAALMVAASDPVEKAMMVCLSRCLYNNQKIIDATFDKPEARADYYEIVLACGKENLGPLAESLRSKFAEHGLLKTQADTKENQKSELTTNAPS